jgi:hypothetical protein
MPSINAIAIAIQTDQVGLVSPPVNPRVRITQDSVYRDTQDGQLRIIQ